ncbi:MAG: hypothetical protein ACR2P8_15220, partial [Myxococcota bacterium]
MRTGTLAALLLVALWPASGHAYPGGTPSYQTDAAPFCAGCHSSRNVEMLEGAGERAQKELTERKHISLILSGRKNYQGLTETDRKTLAEQIRALDEASTVVIAAPLQVQAGATFEVRVNVTGGAGPVVGVALVDRAHRWYARPAASVGWQVVEPPKVVGSDGKPQDGWLGKRPEEAGREVSYVNITDIASDSAAKKWATGEVTFILRAPPKPGTYPLAAAYLYGTEKSTVLGYTTNAVGWKEPRGGVGGGSGRVLFSDVLAIEVLPPIAPTQPERGAPPPQP